MIERFLLDKLKAKGIINVQDIMNKTGVSQRTVYNYFEDKCYNIDIFKYLLALFIGNAEEDEIAEYNAIIEKIKEGKI